MNVGTSSFLKDVCTNYNLSRDGLIDIYTIREHYLEFSIRLWSTHKLWLSLAYNGFVLPAQWSLKSGKHQNRGYSQFVGAYPTQKLIYSHSHTLKFMIHPWYYYYNLILWYISGSFNKFSCSLQELQLKSIWAWHPSKHWNFWYILTLIKLNCFYLLQYQDKLGLSARCLLRQTHNEEIQASFLRAQDRSLLCLTKMLEIY